MNETTKTVFEKYEIRKSGKQKAAFREFVKSVATENGYKFSVHEGSMGAKNIVIGEPTSAKVIYTAHYDTCPVLPFPNFITPKNFGIYLLYQLFITVVLIAVIFPIAFGAGMIATVTGTEWLETPIRYVLYFGILYLLLAGPANKHTANDNTSGVCTLLSIMEALDPSQRDKVAFVFFDLEETGLIGSASFAKIYNKRLSNTPVVNFDCVSDGENMLFVLKKGSKHLKETIEKAFEPIDGISVEVADKGVFYPSDQKNFNCGVGVAALKKTKKGILYMDRIHTKRDTVYREENVEFLKNGAVRLIDLL